MSKGLKIGVSALALMMSATTAQQAAATDWTGFYAGVHAGYGMGEATDSFDCSDSYWDWSGLPLSGISLMFGTKSIYCDYFDAPAYYYGPGYYLGYPVATESQQYDYSDDSDYSFYNYDTLNDFSGWLIGGQAGYLYQSGSFVLGAEVSASASSISDSADYWYEWDEPEHAVETQLSVDWLASAVVRAGYTPTDNVLLSVNGGLAMAGATFDYMSPLTGSFTDSTVATGWTAGAQVDVMLTDTISVFGAYSYTQLLDVAFDGSTTLPEDYYGPDTNPEIPIQNYREYDLGIHAIKVGVNNRFN